MKVSYSVQNLFIQQEIYKKMCNAFSEVANIASNDENSYNTVLDCIEKAMKDLPKQICCESVEKTNIGGPSCSNNVQLALNDPVVTRRKGRPPSLTAIIFNLH